MSDKKKQDQMNERFFLEDPCNLFKNLSVIPLGEGSYGYKLNALTRLFILISLALYFVDNKYSIHLLAVGLSVILVLYIIAKNKEDFVSIRGTTTADRNGPSGNVFTNQRRPEGEYPRTYLPCDKESFYPKISNVVHSNKLPSNELPWKGRDNSERYSTPIYKTGQAVIEQHSAVSDTPAYGTHIYHTNFKLQPQHNPNRSYNDARLIHYGDEHPEERQFQSLTEAYNFPEMRVPNPKINEEPVIVPRLNDVEV